MSNQMNPWLASIYGTDGADDLEKTAQAHLLQKLAADGNLDISQFTPQELEQIVQELAAEGYDVGSMMQPGQQPQVNTPQPPVPGMGGNPMQTGGQQPNLPSQSRPQAFAPANQQQMPQGMNPQMMQQQPQQSGMEAMQKEAQAKFEEADLLGRVMAHSYTDELEKIGMTKRAGKVDAAKNAIKGAAGKARGHVKSNKGAYAAGAGAAGAGFAAGRMSKKASAFEKLAEEHAAEILSQTGYDPSTGQDLYGQQMLQNAMPQQGQPQQPQQVQQPQSQQPMYQQQAAGVEQPQVEQGSQFTEALDSRALELLAENGYDVNEILARVQLAQQQQPQAQA